MKSQEIICFPVPGQKSLRNSQTILFQCKFGEDKINVSKGDILKGEDNEKRFIKMAGIVYVGGACSGMYGMR